MDTFGIMIYSMYAEVQVGCAIEIRDRERPIETHSEMQIRIGTYRDRLESIDRLG
jgi:hypothetical protein